jgi:hypothetical protein
MSVRTHSPSRSLHRVSSTAATAVEGAAFWTSVALPFTYLPLLAASTVTDLGVPTIGAIVVANALALVVGHGYDPAETEDGE